MGNNPTRTQLHLYGRGIYLSITHSTTPIHRYLLNVPPRADTVILSLSSARVVLVHVYRHPVSRPAFSPCREPFSWPSLWAVCVACGLSTVRCAACFVTTPIIQQTDTLQLPSMRVVHRPACFALIGVGFLLFCCLFGRCRIRFGGNNMHAICHAGHFASQLTARSTTVNRQRHTDTHQSDNQTKRSLAVACMCVECGVHVCVCVVVVLGSCLTNPFGCLGLPFPSHS